MGAERSYGRYRKHKVEFKHDAVEMTDIIKNFCASQGISEIPLSDDDLRPLKAVPRYSALWSNRQVVPDPYAYMEEYIDECLRKQYSGNYILFGMAGHGELSSWALHLYVVQDNFAYFGQMNWGGALIELNPEEKTRAEIYMRVMFTTYTHLRGRFLELIEADQIPAQGKRLIVVGSNHGCSGVGQCMLMDDAGGYEQVNWRHTDSIFRTPYAVGLSILSEFENVAEVN